MKLRYRRFCPLGHDKEAKGGVYKYKTALGFDGFRCAICHRARMRKYHRRRRLG